MTEPSNSELKTNFDQFGPELVYSSNCILQDIAPEPSGEEDVANVRNIQALLESQDKKRPMRIAAVEEIERSAEEQELHRPPPHFAFRRTRTYFGYPSVFR